jgi:4,5-dihydroxyphthalate decarboxylase
VHWRYGGVETPEWHERLAHDTPPGIDLQRVPEDRSLVDMLLAGELDALALTHAPTAYYAPERPMRRLVVDYVALEQEYYRRTRLFPIMHCIVVRRDVYTANPWVAQSLYDAFVQSKRAGMELVAGADVPYPWWQDVATAELQRLFEDGDAFPYGIAANRTVLESGATYSYEQGLSARRVTVEELFAPELLGT